MSVARAFASRALLWARSYPTVPLRRAMARGGARWVGALPGGIRRRLDLDGAEVRPLRVELGPGPFPTPGYVHVDHHRDARHLEHVAPVWRLPFPDASVQEILAVHVLEHVHPARVPATLAEWRRVLAPGGFVQAHVPNAPAIMHQFIQAPPDRKWLFSAALHGLGVGPELASSEAIPLTHEPDHRADYDAELLRQLFLAAGFGEVEDLTGQVGDRHTEGWRGVVDDISIVVRAWA